MSAVELEEETVRSSRDGEQPVASETPGGDEAHANGPIDPRAVRVGVAATSRLPSDPTITVAPAPVPVEPLRDQLAGVGILGGVPAGSPPGGNGSGTAGANGGPGRGPGEVSPGAADPSVAPMPLIDGRPVPVRLEWLDDARAVLVRGEGESATRTPVLLGQVRDQGGTAIREVVVDGWRLDLELESERRAALRERSRRATEAAGRTGPLEVHAIIPGRIVAVSVAAGDAVTAGQVLLVLEAMKMQNELRAPRDGTVERVAIAVGGTVEVGDLLMVIS